MKRKVDGEKMGQQTTSGRAGRQQEVGAQATGESTVSEPAGPYIEFRQVSKIYRMGDVEIRALNKTSFTVDQGELVVILGQSGAGKTTALNILGGMDRVTSGSFRMEGQEVTTLKERELIRYRREKIGFVFQFYNLIQNLTALENVELAVQLCKDHMVPRTALNQVGLEDRKNNFPSQLSGGEQQRVAIARAIAKKPKLLLCDEPTGALDYVTGRQILRLLEKMCRKERMTVVIVTHNSAIAPMADKVIHFKSGRVEEIRLNRRPKSIDELEW